MISLNDCLAMDQEDPLRPFRDQFSIPPGIIYLDGNSLGVMPQSASQRATEVVQNEWGVGLIRSWNSAHWFDLPQRLGNKIAPLIGAQANQVVVSDSTSINLYKVLHAALQQARQDSPQRRVVLSERNNFPTDLYIAENLCRAFDCQLQLVDANTPLVAHLNDDIAVLLLTHVNYRTGSMHDLASITAAAHQAGALTVWDLAHSVGAVEVDLLGADADFAIGCTYKYLNGGPGAPAFVWVNPRHVDRFVQPLSGWWGHQSPFAFTPDYAAAPGISRYLCGTQGIVSLALLECGLTIFGATSAVGGMAAIRKKSLALTDLFIQLVAQRCDHFGLALATPRAHHQRGSHVCLTRAREQGESTAFAIVQALIQRGVIGDYRAGDGGEMPDILRFGFTPLYLQYADVWHAVDQLHAVLESQEWRRPEFNQRPAVT